MEGLGAFNAEERKLANDLLGFKAHIVFPMGAFDQVLAAKDQKIILGGVEALNKGMATFVLLINACMERLIFLLPMVKT